MKGVIFENILTKELVVSDNPTAITVIDGEEYITVSKLNEARYFLIRLDALKRIKDPRDKR
jgi:hypothetical protein